MGNIGAWELIIIAILVIVIFGGKKLPELGRGLGKGLANFRQAVKEPDKPAAATPEAESASADPPDENFSSSKDL
ncbi:twin-arginine translocase TatA/TatE family subunit [Deltaproteobacteria bacterium Smac51]|nr:twin-arginine translocase TatA/TatE family subunit [Deltaproteobacteria bacterium Smac51]